jgi:replicative DNA helicase
MNEEFWKNRFAEQEKEAEQQSFTSEDDEVEDLITLVEMLHEENLTLKDQIRSLFMRVNSQAERLNALEARLPPE